MGAETLVQLVETGGPVAAGIIAVLVVLFLGLKFTGVGVSFGNSKTLVDDTKITAVASGIDGINDKLENVEKRITAVENDVERRATRDEVHQLELSITRMEARMEAVDGRTNAIAHGVSRIEGFLYEAALQAKRRSDQ